MAISKIILNGVTQMDVTQDTVASSNLLSGYTATKNDGTQITGSYIPSTPSLQTKTKTYTPTESIQTETITADSGYDGLNEVDVTVNPIPYADGDNETYGTTSEIWLINATPTITEPGMTTYNIDFISNNTTYNEIQLYSSIISGISYSGAGIVYNSSSGGWTNQAYRTIEITGGADKDNANWRAWLEANAVQQ